MQQEKNKFAIATTWGLVVICMGIIFYFSSRTATESSQQSNYILEFITKIFGDNGFTDFIVRKSAHFLEFTGLALLVNIAMLTSCTKVQPLLSIAITSLYAVSDEIHQIFVEGRACRLMDWGIDTAGAILGTIVFLIVFQFAIIPKITKNKKKPIDTSKNAL
jgi:VanZ family protein